MDKKQKMVPKLRFPGFTDDWEQRKLSDEFSNFIVPMRDKPKEFGGNIPWTRIEDIEGKYLNGTLSDQYVTEETVKQMNLKIIPKDSLIVSSSATFGVVAVVTNDLITNQTFIGLVPNEKETLDYWYAYFHSDEARKYMKLQSAGSTIFYIARESFENMPISVPSKEERMKIGQYFDDLDNLITLHQRKLYQMKNYKQGLLQKMFPKNGEHIPEIRFPGFTDAWEQRKFDEWGDFYYGHSCPKWSVTEDATTPCIRYGELYTKFGAKIDKVYSYTNMPPEKLRFSKGTEVLIPRVGEDPMDYNHCTWLSLKGVAIGEMISVFNTDQDPLFSATMFNATLQKEFAIRVEGGSVTNLYFDKLRNIDISYPSLPEQKKIAAFFENIDNLITLHQRKLDQVKEYKKGLLQQMFV